MRSAADSLTLDEITALQRDYSSYDAASTVSINLEETSSPSWVPAAAITLDPVFGFAEPITVSEDIPDQNLDIANPVDRLVQREKDHKVKLSAFSHPMAKFHAMDLFDIRYQLRQFCDYIKTVFTCWVGSRSWRKD